jgi:hypothetical protein
MLVNHADTRLQERKTRLWIVLALCVVCFTTADAWADKYTQVISSGLTSAIDGTIAEPFRVEIEGRCIDGYVQYKITNLGEDWPRTSFFGVFLANTTRLYINRRFRLLKGQTVIFRADFKGQPARPLDMWIRPQWLDQDFLVRFKHTAPEGWQEAGKVRSTLGQSIESFVLQDE